MRNIGYRKLLQRGSNSIAAIKPLLDDNNAYIQARAVWLLAAIGGKGKSMVEQLLGSKDIQLRAVAYKALRANVPGNIPYAEKMVNDPSPFIRREVAASLQQLTYAQTKPLLLQLIKNYDGEDRWYLETIGAVLQDHEADIYPDIVALLAKDISPTKWNAAMASLAWRLHSPQAIPALMLRAEDSLLSLKERTAAITALAFINKKAAVDSMFALTKSSSKDVTEQAAYWLSFRQSNDWYALADWSKIPLNTAYERTLAQMKVKQQMALDEHQSNDERKWRVQELPRIL